MNKRGYTITLEKLVVMIPKIIVLIALLYLLFSLYSLIVRDRNKEQIEYDLRRIAREISAIEKDEEAEVPILATGKFNLITFNVDVNRYECKDKACICANYWKEGEVGEIVGCETFTGFGKKDEKGKFYFVTKELLVDSKDKKLLKIKRTDLEKGANEISLSLPAVK